MKNRQTAKQDFANKTERALAYENGCMPHPQKSHGTFFKISHSI